MAARRLLLPPTFAIAALSRRLRLAIALGLLSAAGFSPATALAAFPGANGEIAYVQNPASEPYNNEIFAIKPDGSNPHPLTSDSLPNDAPSFSADGQWIVFLTLGSNGRSTIWIMDAGGGDRRMLVKSPGRASPSFSPDGRKVVYSTVRAIKTVSIATGEQQVVLKSFDKRFALDDPAYSPDGRLIAFSGVPEGAKGKALAIWTVRPNGKRLRKVTHPGEDNEDFDNSPDFSPDGRTIAFSRGPLYEVLVVDRDGGKERSLTASGYDYPAFAPAGDALLVSSAGDRYGGCADIFSITLDSGEMRPVTDNCETDDGIAFRDGSAFAPSWQPLP